MLLFSSVRKAYGSYDVLDIPQLELTDTLYWLKGPNGTGKTTLLKMLAGIAPFEGDLILDSVSQKKESVKYRLQVNYAEAEPVYPSFITGDELLAMFRQAKHGTHDQVTALRNCFGIDAYAHKPVGTYSSGMIKRLSLALACIGEPRLLLLDEPLVTLDTGIVPVLMQQIREWTTGGTTVILTSHQSLDEWLPHITPLYLENKTVCRPSTAS